MAIFSKWIGSGHYLLASSLDPELVGIVLSPNEREKVGYYWNKCACDVCLPMLTFDIIYRKNHMGTGKSFRPTGELKEFLALHCKSGLWVDFNPSDLLVWSPGEQPFNPSGSCCSD